VTRGCRVFAVLSAIAAAPAAGAFGEDWVLAASAFAAGENAGGAEAAAAAFIPRVMLDFFSADMARAVQRDELDARKLYELRFSREKLFLELSGAVKTRDALALTRRTLKSRNKLREEEKKIAEVKKRIDDNSAEADKILAQKSGSAGRSEQIVLWKNDDTALFAPPENKTLETALMDEKINGLISGSIYTVDEYAAVTASLRTAPGGAPSAPITEIGRITEAAGIARRLAFSLMKDLLQTRPAHIAFDIPEKTAGLVISVDDMTFTSIPESVAVHDGVHSVVFSAPGYDTEALSADFETDKNYVIGVTMRKTALEKITLALRNAVSGSFLINAMGAGSTAEDNPSITINAVNFPIFGRFDVPEKPSSFFYLPLPDKGAMPQNWNINPKNRDIGARIELSRKIMYASYAALLVSVPAMIITLGEFEVRNKTVATWTYENKPPDDRITEIVDEQMSWYRASQVCTGITIGLGVNFAVQLAIYLIRASEALPEKARPAQ